MNCQRTGQFTWFWICLTTDVPSDWCQNWVSGGKKKFGEDAYTWATCSDLNIKDCVIENQTFLTLGFMYYIKVFSNYFCYSPKWRKKIFFCLCGSKHWTCCLSVPQRDGKIYFYSAKFHWNIMDETANTKEWKGRYKHAKQWKYALPSFSLNAIWEVEGK